MQHHLASATIQVANSQLQLPSTWPSTWGWQWCWSDCHQNRLTFVVSMGKNGFERLDCTIGLTQNEWKSIKNLLHCLKAQIIKYFDPNHSMILFGWFDSLCPSQQFFSYVRMDIPGLNQYLTRINVSCSRIQHSNAGEAWTCFPSVSSQALYHWATMLPS